jgi:predicted nucleic acid-binding protein
VIEVVLDASVVLKWFRGEGERHLAAARSLRTRFETGQLLVVVPSLLHLEIANVAGRRWGWDEKALIELATALAGLGFELKEPTLEGVARWTARGLTAYDATYVALAEAEAIRLVSDDDLILTIAPRAATALAGVAEMEE